jgi:hypothetical protein
MYTHSLLHLGPIQYGALVAASISSPGGTKLVVSYSVFLVPLRHGIGAGLARSVAFFTLQNFQSVV